MGYKTPFPRTPKKPESALQRNQAVRAPVTIAAPPRTRDDSSFFAVKPDVSSALVFSAQPAGITTAWRLIEKLAFGRSTKVAPSSCRKTEMTCVPGARLTHIESIFRGNNRFVFQRLR
jgi:hypothetical protein